MGSYCQEKPIYYKDRETLTLFNSFAPVTPEFATSGIFERSRLSVNKKSKKYTFFERSFQISITTSYSPFAPDLGKRTLVALQDSGA